MKSTQFAAFTAASGALAVAKANTHDLDIARGALDVAEAAGVGALDLTAWAAAHAGQFLNVRSVKLSGNLRALVLGIEGAVAGDLDDVTGVKIPSASGDDDPPALEAEVDVVVVGHEFNVDFKFRPGQANKFITDITRAFWDDLKGVVHT